MSYSSEVMADSPKGYWRMNDASGNPQDSSGNAHHVTTTTGTPTYSQTSPITTDAAAKAIHLPNGAYFSVPDHADWDIGSNAVTLEAWVKRDSTALSTNIISHQDTGYLMSIYDTDDQLHLVASQTSEVFQSSGTMNDTNWHHVVVSFDNISEDGATWIDGSREAKTSATFLTDTAVALLIGADTTAAGVKGNMYIAEVAVYISADTMADGRVQAHYAAATSATAGGAARMLTLGVG